MDFKSLGLAFLYTAIFVEVEPGLIAKILCMIIGIFNENLVPGQS